MYVWTVKDLEMFDEVTDTPTVARTSNLNEELGQVCLLQYIVYLLFPFIYIRWQGPFNFAANSETVSQFSSF